MNRQEAYDLLNLSEHSAPSVMEEKYREAYNQLQLLLTNAPTPNLKKLYQRNLQELEEAYRIVKATTVDEGRADLPSATPVYEPLRVPESELRSSPPVFKPETDSAPNLQSNKIPNSPTQKLVWIAILIVLGVLVVVRFWFVKNQNDAGQTPTVSAMKAPEPGIALSDTVSGSANESFSDGRVPDPPNPARLVNDFAGMLSVEEQSRLEQKLRAYNDRTSNQIAIVIVKEVNEPIGEFARKVGNKWGVGQKDKNNGVVVAWAAANQKIFISVGYGLEKTLTNQKCQEIIDQLIPSFKNENWFQGLDRAVDGIINGINQ